jgi:hypothetical protein
MELPENISLPFFAYGIFKKGQISFFRIKDYIEEIKPIFFKGQLLILDGLPMLDISNSYDNVKGDVLYFKANSHNDAYKNIAALEPDSLYKWSVIETEYGKANALICKYVGKGSVNDYGWDSWKDPLFSTIFELIDEELCKKREGSLEGKDFLRLQMTYMLLWTAIERYVTLRYSLGNDGIMEKINHIAQEEAFLKGLSQSFLAHRKIYSTAHSSDKFVFDINNPRKCIKYYYQVRSNITHRGKASFADEALVRNVLKELAHIFKNMLEDAQLASGYNEYSCY